jgi:hypothetical protein
MVLTKWLPIMAAILFLASEEQTLKVSENDHSISGQSGFRMLTVQYSGDTKYGLSNTGTI